MCQDPPDPQFIAPVNTQLRYQQPHQSRQSESVRGLSEAALLTPTFDAHNGAVNDFNQSMQQNILQVHQQQPSIFSSQVQLKIKDIISRSDYLEEPPRDLQRQPGDYEGLGKHDSRKQSIATMNSGVIHQSIDSQALLGGKAPRATGTAGSGPVQSFVNQIERGAEQAAGAKGERSAAASMQQDEFAPTNDADGSRLI